MKRGAKKKAERVHFHKHIPIGCFEQVYNVVEITLGYFCKENNEKYRPPKTITIKEGQKSVNYHRYIPTNKIEWVKNEIDKVVSEYKEESK
jgi:hypothetical protein